VLVTIVILSTGIVLVLQAFENSLFALAESRDTMDAHRIIQEKMEDTETSVLRAAGSGPARLDSNGIEDGFHWEVNVDEITVADGAKLQEVTVTVWRKDRNRQYSGTTYIETQ